MKRKFRLQFLSPEGALIAETYSTHQWLLEALIKAEGQYFSQYILAEIQGKTWVTIHQLEC